MSDKKKKKKIRNLDKLKLWKQEYFYFMYFYVEKSGRSGKNLWSQELTLLPTWPWGKGECDWYCF